MTVDDKSLDLARHFLQDEVPLNTDKNVQSLAWTIQNAVEDWLLEAKCNHVEPPAEPLLGIDRTPRRWWRS
ncbi:MAG TPA: hypothetical protein VGR63_08810 [Casimicrobiaceae bacterium]|jgi:hypothetical protein|nr:hypothetical protein [Casimicrobiaceae bacterium]